jgi:hypothetical protein
MIVNGTKDVHDAERIFEVEEIDTKEPDICISGLVLRGVKKPKDCPAFGKQCTPECPLGPRWFRPKERAPPTMPMGGICKDIRRRACFALRTVGQTTEPTHVTAAEQRAAESGRWKSFGVQSVQGKSLTKSSSTRIEPLQLRERFVRQVAHLSMQVSRVPKRLEAAMN